MTTLFASLVALCVADAAPTHSPGDFVLVWGGANCGRVADVSPGVAGMGRAAPTMFRFVSNNQDAEPAKAWIGVRLAPVPEALAAHLDRTGLMVANVAKDSPADAAGLERYDVIVAFDGVATENAEDLVAAIGDVGPGGLAKITVLRKGGERELRITPAGVPALDAVEYKYEQPADPVVDDKTSIRGHTLRIGPDGQLQLQDLGQLDNLPEALRQFWALTPNAQFDWHAQPPGQGAMQWHMDLDDANAQSRVELRIQTSENGETLMVHRDADGRITVERTDASGKKSTAEYDDAEALEREDADAYQFYQRNGGGGIGHWMRVHPNIDALPGLQKNFREQIERRVKDLRDQADRNAQKRWHAAPGRSDAPGREDSRRRVRVQTRTESGDADGAAVSEAISVVVDDDGRITVKVSRNGNKAEYSFKDEADFKAREPELFERYRKMAE